MITEKNTAVTVRKDDADMHFGGIIYLTDFETGYCNGNTAQRIMSDLRFDRQCLRNTELRDRLSTNTKTEEAGKDGDLKW